MSASVGAYVHLDGRLVPAAQARIKALDRGFLYGDGVFETLRIYKGRPFAMAQHFERMRAAAVVLGLQVPKRPWARDIAALVQRNGMEDADGWVRITVTRGAGTPGLLPPPRLRPTVLMFAGRLARGVRRAQRSGVRVILLPFARRGFLAELKLLDYVPGILGRRLAAKRDAYEGLYVDADGCVTEAATANVFIWNGKRVITPPADGILPGVTRRLVIDLATADGFRVEERRLKASELLTAREAWLTSSTAEVVPIVAVGRHRIADGSVGTRVRRLQEIYRQLVDKMLA